MKKGKIVIVSGFSGVGKGTVVKKIMETYDNYELSVSMTTRDPRPGEVEGVNYHYVSDGQFEEMIKADGFLEFAGYVGHYYGTPKAFVLDSLEKGKNVILEIEVQGAMQIKEKYPDTMMIFIVPPKAEDLRNRLIGRGSESGEEIEKRLRQAYEETKKMKYYEYFVVNDDLEECVRHLNDVITTDYEKTPDKEKKIEQIQKELKTLIENQ